MCFLVFSQADTNQYGANARQLVYQEAESVGPQSCGVLWLADGHRRGVRRPPGQGGHPLPAEGNGRRSRGMRHGEFYPNPRSSAATILTASIFARIVVEQEELLQLKNIPKSLAVFCLATYGEGDPTDNAMEFFEWIQGDVDLTGLNYAVSLYLYFRTFVVSILV